MERETDVDPVIDMTAPGSETDQADGSASQLTFEETLDYRGTEDVLDEGYSPPDYPPSVDVPTPAEELQGESLDQRLAEEVPDVSGDDEEERDPLAEVAAVHIVGTEPGDEDDRDR
jgi:hypothetical protein